MIVKIIYFLSKSTEMDLESYFNCAECSFIYDQSTKKPVCLPCGHSICIVCFKKLKKCCVCFKSFDPNANYPINEALMKIVQLKENDFNKLVKVILIGSTGVGKSCLLNALIG
jgi:hypothetical protein